MRTRLAPLHVKGFGGLGDQVYQRPLVRHLARERGELWLSTPYPELYGDLLGVNPVLWRAMKLRCQAKNMEMTPPDVWRQVPDARAERISISYGGHFPRRGILTEMEESARTRIKDFQFDLPDFGPTSAGRGGYAVIRPASVRTEWTNHARNPDPAYLAEAAQLLRQHGLQVICVGDIDGAEEVLVGEMPPADAYFVRGELTTRELFGLIQHAAVVVGGVGWLLPTAMAYRTPAVIIGGGLGRHNDPSLLTDPRMGERPIRFLSPDPYCRCGDLRHCCVKAIPDFAGQLERALDALLVAQEVAA